MELVNDHHGERRRVQGLDSLRFERLNGGKHMFPLRRFVAINIELTEGPVLQDFSVRVQRLIENASSARIQATQ